MEKTQKTVLERLTESYGKFQNKENKFLFFVPDTMGIPSGAVIEIYNQANILRKNGYNVIIFGDKEDFPVPTYIDQECQTLTHKSLKKAGNNQMVLDIEISPEDFMIIPDFFTNIMETTKNLPCQRIVLAQSYEYITNSLLPGMKYSDFGIKHIIATSNKLKEFIEEFHGKETYDISVYTIGIPDYFKNKPFKKPTIAFVSRNASDVLKITRLFYLKYPELRWISFEEIRNVSREKFADKLSESVACLWIDRIASFGTLPLEAMKCGVVPVGLVPEVVPSYLVENAGVWVDNIYKLPDFLATVVKMSLEDNIPNIIYDTMKQVSDNHSIEISNESIMNVYNDVILKRDNEYVQFMEFEKQKELNPTIA
jgi:hypothetical protein